MRWLSPCSLAWLLLIGCGSESEISELDGIWRTVGDSNIVVVQGDSNDVYHLTSDYCYLAPSGQSAPPGPGNIVPQATESIFTGEPGARKLELHLDTGSIRYFIELAAVPEACVIFDEAQTSDPELNFEVFWQTFHENYAFFELRGVDWNAQYQQYRSRVTAETTPEQLFQVLNDMLSPLDDAHVEVTAALGIFSPGSNYPRADLLGEFLSIIEMQYVIGGSFSTTDNGQVFYGLLKQNVGYMNLGSFAYYDPNNTEGTAANEYAAIDATFDQVFAELQDTDALIIDLRLSPGGLTLYRNRIAAKFTDATFTALRTKLTDTELDPPEIDVVIEPYAGTRYTKPVYVLASGYTASAAEHLTLALGQLDQVQVIGEPTRGTLSSVLTKILPNGWAIRLSNNVIRAPDGTVYEAQGVPADTTVTFSQADIDAQRDPFIDIVFSMKFTAKLELHHP
ncbi:MAG: S41 family peptidase [Myxococcales bacterium]|nr:S41 family peptidase [Myxococcales bacterium]